MRMGEFCHVSCKDLLSWYRLQLITFMVLMVGFRIDTFDLVPLTKDHFHDVKAGLSCPNEHIN